jgi:cephalosporin-C deacetylase-like acetyl esterase
MFVMYNAEKNLVAHLGEDVNPPGTRNSIIYWLQRQVAKESLKLKRNFTSLGEWELYKSGLRKKLVDTIGFPEFPAPKPGSVRARIRLGEDVLVERVDVYADDDYAIPAFVFSPIHPPREKMPALIWSPGWPQTKWEKNYELFGERMAKQGFVVLILDHAPFGETAEQDQAVTMRTTLVNSAGMLIGISQLAFRAAENIRCKEYLKQRADVIPDKIALAGLCQGGQDTWLAAALDDEFCAVAPFCAQSTFTIHMTEMSSYRINGDSTPFPFGILKVCDVEHLAACIAPRPLLVRSNLPDDWWPISGFDDIESFSRKIYRFYGCEDNMDFRAEINVHDLYGPFADALEGFLNRICY